MTAARGYGAPRLGDSAVPVESEGAELDLGPRSAWVDVTASPQSCLRWRMRSAAPSHGAPPDTSDRRPVGAHGGTGRHKPAGSGTPPCPRRHLTVRLAQTVAGRGRTPRPRFRWRSDRDLQPGVDEAPTGAGRPHKKLLWQRVVNRAVIGRAVGSDQSGPAVQSGRRLRAHGRHPSPSGSARAPAAR
jgi:hypothetical protein